MKFVIESISKCSGRIGLLSKGDRSLKTPLLLLYTKGGSIPHLSNETFNYLNVDSFGLQISVETTHLMQEALFEYKAGISTFAGHPNSISYVTLRDAAEPSVVGYQEKGSVSIFPRSGKVLITSDKYMDLMEAYRPDMFHLLCDGETDQKSSKKRVSKAVERTESFVKNCMERYRGSKILTDSMVIMPIEGGYNQVARERMITELNPYCTEIGGYFIDGFHNNGPSACNIDWISTKEIIDRCVQLLPVDKLKIISGPYNPLTVLGMIQSGIDVFDSSYVYLATAQNCALTFTSNHSESKDIKVPFVIDLKESRYQDDFKPFVDDCSCLACRKHSRAYVNHLINTRELLAPILLMIHNTHHYLEFFKTIHRAIAADTLPDLIELIKSQQSDASNIVGKEIH